MQDLRFRLTILGLLALALGLAAGCSEPEAPCEVLEGDCPNACETGEAAYEEPCGGPGDCHDLQTHLEQDIQLRAALRGVGEITRNGGARHAEGDKQDQHPASPPSDPTDDRDPIFHRHTDCLEKPVWMLPEPSRGGNQE